MKCHQPYCTVPEGEGCEHDPWRRLTAGDLDLPPDREARTARLESPVRFNGHRVSTLGEYSNLYLPGGYPFLLGMQGFWTIEVPDERFTEVKP
jgi:hypothetical protein